MIAGMSVMSTTFTALAYNIVFLRERGVLKRIRGTPLPTISYFGGVAANAVTNTALQIAIIVLAGRAFFGIGWPAHWDALIVFVLVGVVCFAALGVAFAHVIPNFESTAAYVNAVFLPVVAISFYVFDSTSAPRFPAHDRRSAAAEAADRRAVRGDGRGRGLGGHLDALAVIALWGVLGLYLAVRGFSWEAAAHVRQLAEDVHLLRGRPRNAINVYVVGDVLIDAATRQGEQRIMRELAGRTLSAHALTHAHPDHQGSSHAICERLQIPLWCGQGDVPAMETPGGIHNPQAPGWLNRLQHAVLDRTAAPGRARARRGRRGGRLHRARDARTLARAPRLLARVRPRPDPRRRAQQRQRQDRDPRACTSRRRCSRRTPPATAPRRAGSRRCDRGSTCFGHGAAAARPRQARRLRRAAARLS